MIDYRVVRARTPPSLWPVAADDAPGSPNGDGARANQGLSPSGLLANIKNEKINAQIEKQRRYVQRVQRDELHGNGETNRTGIAPLPAWSLPPCVASKRQNGANIASHACVAEEDSIEDLDGVRFAARLDAHIEEFRIESGNIERTIQDMSRKIRLEDGTATHSKEKERAKREEMLREKELEIRRARKEEQIARDPRRKIELQLENKRRFESEGFGVAENSAIPMQTIDVHGATGRERVALVDVRVLRSRCQLLQEGAKVQDLIEAQTQADRRKQTLKVSRALANEVSLSSSSSAPDLALQSSTITGTSSSSRRPASVSDEKLRSMYMKKQERANDAFLRRVYHMRSDIPETVTDRFGFVDQATRHRDSLDSDSSQLTTFANPLFESIARSSIQSNVRRSSSSLSRFSTSAIGSFNSRVSMRKRRSKRFAGASLEEVERAALAHTKAKRRWRATSAVSAMIGVRHEVKTHDDAIFIVKDFMRRFGEWTRMKSATTRLLNSIRKVQACFREFRRSKHKHLLQLDHAWEEYEDRFLRAYFKQYCKKLFETDTDANADFNSLAAQAKRDLMHNSAFMDEILHWHKFRIPLSERRPCLEQYYRVQRRRHVHLQDNLFEIVNSASGWEQELNHFLSRLNAVAGQTPTRAPEMYHESKEEELRRKQAKPRRFYDLPENDCLAMITLLAKSLFDVEPFQDHPANNDVLQKVLGGTKVGSKFSMPAGMEMVCSAGKDGKRSDWKSVAGGALYNAAVAGGGFEADDDNEPPHEEDLEEVLEGFTPRRVLDDSKLNHEAICTDARAQITELDMTIK